MDAEGEAVLCDFGLTRIKHEVTRTQTSIREGSRLRYLAPELTFGPESFRTTAKSDVYSLAITFFHLSTLCTPFKELNEWAAADAARCRRRPEKFNAPRFLAGSFDVLWELLELMWAHEKSARPTMAVVVDELQKILLPVT